MSFNANDIADSAVMVDLGPATTGRPARVGLRATVRTIARLVHARRWIYHLPTRAQIRTMAALDGRLPMSYPLDRSRNFVPPELESMGYADQLGRCGLAFDCEVQGLAMEIVALPNGAGFDLFGVS
jgi:hypothetical protein